MTSKHEVYMANARNYAELSKCVRLQVGCVIINEHGRTISTGVNGSGKDQINCNEVDHGEGHCNHHAWSLVHELHAEKNALFNLIDTGARAREMTFYVTHSPCQSCLTDIVIMSSNMNIDIPMIVFDKMYDRMTDEQMSEQAKFCSQYGIRLVDLQTLLDERHEQTKRRRHQTEQA